MARPRFLSRKRILAIHEDQLGRYGGLEGHDENRLDSSLNMPKSGTKEGYLHSFPFGMAAAYLFYIVQDHPFVDGNKRTGTLAALAFLESNGVRVSIQERVLVEFVMDIAAGGKSREQVEKFLEEHRVPAPESGEGPRADTP